MSASPTVPGLTPPVYVHHEPLILNIHDFMPIDHVYPTGTHLFFSPVVFNWLGGPRFYQPGWRQYIYYAPVTINYIGRGTHGASLPGHNIFHGPAVIHSTQAAWDGANNRGVNDFHTPAVFMSLPDGAVPPGADPSSMPLGGDGELGYGRGIQATPDKELSKVGMAAVAAAAVAQPGYYAIPLPDNPVAMQLFRQSVAPSPYPEPFENLPALARPDALLPDGISSHMVREKVEGQTMYPVWRP